MLDILLADDEPSILLSVADALRAATFRVTTAGDGEAALVACAAQRFDVILCDVRMPRVDGLTLLRHIRKHAPGTDVILMTAHANVADAVNALKDGATDYLIKPFSLEELNLRVERIYRERTLKKELVDAKRRWSDRPEDRELIGTSPAMVRLQERIERFAASEAPVLVTGESGTGKELVAAALHRKSGRREGPFVAVSCAAFPDTLLEAELFGHERGAFTGAVRKRDGRFKAADGGVLFLDEVGEMPLSSQAKLLRVLQDQTFEPLGTNDSIHVDVRVISATNRNLKEMVTHGRFREDLYYRLKILALEVPTLRERQGDLPVLLEYFLQRFSPGDTPLQVSPAARALLSHYPFPGNVRELEHALRHAVALVGSAGTIEPAHLPEDIAKLGLRKGPGAPENVQHLGKALREFEREYLQNALKLHGGNKGRTAEALGISRKNLWEKLRRHDLVAVDLDEDPTLLASPLPPTVPSGDGTPSSNDDGS